MESKKTHTKSFLKKDIRRKLLTGIIVILPIYVTYFVIKSLIGLVGAALSSVVNKTITIFGGHIPSSAVEGFVVTTIAFILIFVALYFIGAFATNAFGKLLIEFFEKILYKMPFINNIYKSSKQLIKLLSLPNRKAFKRVVIVQYPRYGANAIAFVTGGIKAKDGTELTSVFIPTTPNPTSGFLLYLPESDVVETNMTIEEGMKLVFSGGILKPAR